MRAVRQTDVRSVKTLRHQASCEACLKPQQSLDHLVNAAASSAASPQSQQMNFQLLKSVKSKQEIRSRLYKYKSYSFCPGFEISLSQISASSTVELIEFVVLTELKHFIGKNQKQCHGVSE